MNAKVAQVFRDVDALQPLFTSQVGTPTLRRNDVSTDDLVHAHADVGVVPLGLSGGVAVAKL